MLYYLAFSAQPPECSRSRLLDEFVYPRIIYFGSDQAWFGLVVECHTLEVPACVTHKINPLDRLLHKFGIRLLDFMVNHYRHKSL